MSGESNLSVGMSAKGLFRLRLTGLVLVLLIALWPIGVRADSVLYDVQFTNGAVQTGAAVLGSASDPHWNNAWKGTGNQTTAEVITSVSGNKTANLTFNVDYGSIYDDTSGSPSPSALMSCYAYSPPNKGGIQFTVTGLAAGSYDLVVYSAGDAQGQGSSYIWANAPNGIGSTSAATRDISSGPGVAYAEGTVNVATDGRLYVELVEPSNNYTALNGFQLEYIPPAPLPGIVPGFLLLTGTTGAVGQLRRRQKNAIRKGVTTAL